jgi:hypothetical protein
MVMTIEKWGDCNNEGCEYKLHKHTHQPDAVFENIQKNCKHCGCIMKIRTLLYECEFGCNHAILSAIYTCEICGQREAVALYDGLPQSYEKVYLEVQTHAHRLIQAQFLHY